MCAAKTHLLSYLSLSCKDGRFRGSLDSNSDSDKTFDSDSDSSLLKRIDSDSDPIPIPAFLSDLVPIPIPKWQKISVIPIPESPIFVAMPKEGKASRAQANLLFLA